MPFIEQVPAISRYQHIAGIKPFIEQAPPYHQAGTKPFIEQVPLHFIEHVPS